MPNEHPLRVLIVEDHPIVRLGLCTTINDEPGFALAAEVENAEETLPQILATRPDAVVLPLRLGGVWSGFELCSKIKRLEDAPAIVMFSSFGGVEEASLALEYGADAFLGKRERPAKLIATIREVCGDQRVSEAGRRENAELIDAARERLALLTAREKEILSLLLQRRTNSEIAGELFIGLATVKTHVSQVLQKMSVSNRKELEESRTLLRGFLDG